MSKVAKTGGAKAWRLPRQQTAGQPCGRPRAYEVLPLKGVRRWPQVAAVATNKETRRLCSGGLLTRVTVHVNQWTSWAATADNSRFAAVNEDTYSVSAVATKAVMVT